MIQYSCKKCGKPAECCFHEVSKGIFEPLCNVCAKEMFPVLVCTDLDKLRQYAQKAGV